MNNNSNTPVNTNNSVDTGNADRANSSVDTGSASSSVDTESASSAINSVDTEYISLVKNIINNGYEQGNTIMLPMQTISFSTDPFPLMQHKKMYTKGIWEELLFFLNGQTDVRILQSKNVHIWDANADPEYKKLHNKNLEDHDLGPVYGYQWRNFNSQNKDQLQDIVAGLKNKSFSRRLFMSAWNPCQLDEMVLPPCHVSYHFIPYMKNNEYTVDLMMYQRSADIVLGLPFNIASCAFMLQIICYYCNCKPGNIKICIGNAHIYKEHIQSEDFNKIIDWRQVNYSHPIVNISGDVTKDFNKFLNTIKYDLLNYNINNKLKFSIIV